MWFLPFRERSELNEYYKVSLGMLGQAICVESCASWVVTVKVASVLEVRSYHKDFVRQTV